MVSFSVTVDDATGESNYCRRLYLSSTVVDDLHTLYISIQIPYAVAENEYPSSTHIAYF